MTGRYSTISVEEVISRTKMQLRITDTSEHDEYLEMMIFEGLKSLRTLSNFIKKQVELDVVDLKAKLPNDFYKLLGLRFRDTNDGGLCSQILYSDTNFLRSCDCDTSLSNVEDFRNRFQIIPGYIILSSGTSAETISLAYLGLNMDADGRILIYEDYERALSSYACYMFTNSYADDYKEATIERYHKTWVNQRALIRGLDAANDFQNQKRQIQDIFNSLAVSRLNNF